MGKQEMGSKDSIFYFSTSYSMHFNGNIVNILSCFLDTYILFLALYLF